MNREKFSDIHALKTTAHAAAVVQIPEKSLAEQRRGRYDYIN